MPSVCRLGWPPLPCRTGLLLPTGGTAVFWVGECQGKRWTPQSGWLHRLWSSCAAWPGGSLQGSEEGLALVVRLGPLSSFMFCSHSTCSGFLLRCLFCPESRVRLEPEAPGRHIHRGHRSRCVSVGCQLSLGRQRCLAAAGVPRSSVCSPPVWQGPPRDDVCPARGPHQQVEPRAGGPGEALPSTGHPSQRLGQDPDREWREGRRAPPPGASGRGHSCCPP